MEKMQISVLRVREQQGHVVALARAEAEQARIWIEVRFVAPMNARPSELWQMGYDHVLTYLDPA